MRRNSFPCRESLFDQTYGHMREYASVRAAYGGYPDIDELFERQARERDPAKREGLLHRIQQLTVDRVMYAPIWSTRVLIGVGPRIADHTINLVPLSIWPSYEDMTLKNKS
jgi:peptide/nickel transport system substrate-binding protein